MLAKLGDEYQKLDFEDTPYFAQKYSADAANCARNFESFSLQHQTEDTLNNQLLLGSKHKDFSLTVAENIKKAYI